MDLSCVGFCTFAHSLPWLIESTFITPLGVLAVCSALHAVTRQYWIGSFWFTWMWSTLSIAIAFHWSPGAMAYSLGSGIELGMLVAFPLILWDGFRLACGYWIGSRFANNCDSIWVPVLLCTLLVEYFIPSVFPWRLGFMLMPWTFALQGCDIFGTGWPTVVLFAMSGFTLQVIRYLQYRLTVFRSGYGGLENRIPLMNPFGIASCVVLGLTATYSVYCFSLWKQQLQSLEGLRVGLIQVDPSYTTSLGESQRLTAEVAENVDLICWPESSGGNTELELDDLSNRSVVFAHSRAPERGLQPWPSPKCELLLGGKNYTGASDSPDKLFVTAMLIDQRENIIGRYNKRFLMPFGEYVPFEEFIPGLGKLFDITDTISAGNRATVIESKTKARIGAMLCFEDMVPTAARDMQVRGANILFSLINASAFESKYTLFQHRLLSQLRSIECRRYFLRCSATGETCVISPLGDVLKKITPQTTDYLIAEVKLIDTKTVFSQFPYLLPICTIVFALAWLIKSVHPTSQ